MADRNSAGNWFKNSLRSIGSIGKHVAADQFPVASSTLNSARDAMSDAKSMATNYAGIVRRHAQNTEKGSLARKARATFNEAMDDLKSGNFGFKELEDDFDDFIGNDMEMSFSLNYDEDAPKKSPEEIILGGTKGVAEAVAASSQVNLQAMNQMTQSIVGSTIKSSQASANQIINATIYTSSLLNKNLISMNHTLNSIDQNIASILEVQNRSVIPVNKALMEYMEDNAKAMKQIGTMMENFTAYRNGNIKRTEGFDISGGFDFREYGDYIKKNFQNSAIGGMLSAAKTFAELGKMTGGGGHKFSIADVISKGLPKLVPKPIRESLSRFDTGLEGLMREALYRVGDLSNSSNLLLSMIGDIAGVKRSTPGSIKMGAYKKDAMPWNGIAEQTLTFAIPSYLANIENYLSAIAGSPQNEVRWWDPEAGQFKTRTQVVNEYDSRRQSAASAGFAESMIKLNEYLEKNNVSEENTAQILTNLSEILNQRLTDNGSRNVTASRRRMRETLEGSLDARQLRTIIQLLESGIEETRQNINEFNQELSTGNSSMRYLHQNYRQEYFRTDNTRRIDPLGFLNQTVNGTNVRELITQILREEGRYTGTGISPRANNKDLVNKVTLLLKDGYPGNDPRIRNAVLEFDNKMRMQDRRRELRDQVGAAVGGEERRRPRGEGIAARIDQLSDTLFDIVYGISEPGRQRRQRRGGNAGQSAPTGQTPPPRSPTPTAPEASVPPSGTAGAPIQQQPPAAARTETRRAPVTETPGAATSRLSQRQNRNVNRFNDQTQQFTQMANDIANTSVEGAINRTDQEIENINHELTEQLRNQMDEAPADTVAGSVAQLNNTTRTGMLTILSSFQNLNRGMFGKSGFLSKITESDAFKNSMTKIKNYFIGDEKGVFKDQWQDLKSGASKIFGKTKEELVSGYDWIFRNTMTYLYGDDFEENENYQKHMSALDLKKRSAERRRRREAESIAKKHAADAGRTTVTEEDIELAEQEERAREAERDERIGKISSETPKITETANRTRETGTRPNANEPETAPISESVQRVAENIERSGDEFTEAVFGEEAAENARQQTSNNAAPPAKKKKAQTNFIKKFVGMLPKALAGAAVGAGAVALSGGSLGLIGSLFLPNGPIGGAIAGFGVMMLSQTEAFKSILFGKKNEQGEREGGIISGKLSDAFKKAAPYAVGGAVVGALKHVITGGNGIFSHGALGVVTNALLPGGPLGGALIGMGLGILKNSDTIQKKLFGEKDEDGKRSGGILSKGYNKVRGVLTKASQGASKAIAGGIKGAGIGALTGVTLSHMGLIPAMFSVGGPIGGALVGTAFGIASTTKRFQEFVFGSEQLDENGNPTGKRNKDGLLGRMRNMLMVHVFEPIGDSFQKAFRNTTDWVKEAITFPFRKAFGPIISSFTEIKDIVVRNIQDTFEALSRGLINAVKSTFKTIMNPLSGIAKFIGKSIGNIFSVGTKLTLAPVSAGLNLIGLFSQGKRRREYADFYKNYYSNLGSNLRMKWEGEKNDPNAKHGLFHRANDVVSALFDRNNEMLWAAREGWNQEMTAEGKNALDWRGVPEEQRQHKLQMRARKQEQKRWDKINTLRQKISKERDGREMEFSRSELEKYRKQFADLGIDPSQLTSSDDLNQLIFHRSEFKRRNEGVVLKETPLMQKAREHDSTQLDLQTGYLRTIAEYFAELSLRKNHKNWDTMSNEEKDRLIARINRGGDRRRVTIRSLSAQDAELISSMTDEEWEDYQKSPEYADANLSGYVRRIRNEAEHPAPATGKFQFFRRFTGVGLRFNEARNRTRANTGEAETAEPITAQNTPTPERMATPEDALHRATQPQGAPAQPIRETNTGPSVEESLANIAEQTAVSNMLRTGGKVVHAEDIREAGEATAAEIDNAHADEAEIQEANNNMVDRLLNAQARREEEKEREQREIEETERARGLHGENREKESDEKSDENQQTIVVNNAEEGTKKSGGFFKSLFGGLAGVIGGGLLGKVASGVGNIAVKGFKLWGLASIIIGIIDMISPGFSEKLLDKAQNAPDAIRETVSPFISNIATKVSDGISNAVQTTIEKIPEFGEKVIVPVIDGIANFFVNNSPKMIDRAANIFTALVGPISEAFIKIVPSLGKAIIDGVISVFTGRKSKKKVSEEDIVSQEVQEDGTIIATTVTGERAIYDPETGEYTAYGNQDIVVNGKKVGTAGGTNAGRAVGKTVGRAALDAFMGGSAGKAVLKRGGQAVGALGGAIAGFGLPGLATTGTAVTGAKVGGKVGKAAGAAIEAAGKSTAGTAVKTANSKLLRTMLEKMKGFVSKLGSNALFQKLLNKLGDAVFEKEGNSIIKWIISAIDNCIAGIGKLGSNLNKVTSWVSKKLGFGVAKSIPVIDVAFFAYDTVTGAMEADKLFHVPGDQVDFKMRAISAFMKGLLGIGLWGPCFDVLVELFSGIMGKDFKSEFATAIYGIISSTEDEEELKASQEQLSLEREIYNEISGSNLDENAYNQLANKGVLSNLGSMIKSTWSESERTVRANLKQAHELAEERYQLGYRSQNTLEEQYSGWEKQYDIQLADQTAGTGYGQIKSAAGYGSPLGYGPADVRASATASARAGRTDYAGAAVDKTKNLVADEMRNIIKNLLTNGTFIEAVNRLTNGAAESGANRIVNFLLRILEGAKSILSRADSKMDDIAVSAAQKLGLGLHGIKALPIIEIANAAYNAISGGYEAASLFHVAPSEVDIWMRLISAFIKTFLGIGLIGPVVDILTAILSTGANRDFKTEFAEFLYELITGAKGRARLSIGREKLDLERRIYNNLTESSLNEYQYNQLVNKSLAATAISGAKSLLGLTSEREKETAAAIKSARKQAAEMYDAGVSAESLGYGIGFSQKDSRWANARIGTLPSGKTATMSDAGCGPTALATVGQMLGVRSNLNPGNVGQFAARNGYISQGGANAGLFTQGAAQLGMSGTSVGTGKGLAASLASGRPTIISGQSSSSGDPFTRAGHIVVARGMDRNGNVNVTDPLSGNTKKYSFSKIANHATAGFSYGYGNPKLGSDFWPIGYGDTDSDVTLDTVKTALKGSLTEYYHILNEGDVGNSPYYSTARYAWLTASPSDKLMYAKIIFKYSLMDTGTSMDILKRTGVSVSEVFGELKNIKARVPYKIWNGKNQNARVKKPRDSDYTYVNVSDALATEAKLYYDLYTKYIWNTSSDANGKTLLQDMLYGDAANHGIINFRQAWASGFFPYDAAHMTFWSKVLKTNKDRFTIPAKLNPNCVSAADFISRLRVLAADETLAKVDRDTCALYANDLEKIFSGVGIFAKSIADAIQQAESKSITANGRSRKYSGDQATTLANLRSYLNGQKLSDFTTQSINGMTWFDPNDSLWASFKLPGSNGEFEFGNPSTSADKYSRDQILLMADLLSTFTGKPFTPAAMMNYVLPYFAARKASKLNAPIQMSVTNAASTQPLMNITNLERDWGKGALPLSDIAEFQNEKGKGLEFKTYSRNAEKLDAIRSAMAAKNPFILPGFGFEGSIWGGTTLPKDAGRTGESPSILSVLQNMNEKSDTIQYMDPSTNGAFYSRASNLTTAHPDEHLKRAPAHMVKVKGGGRVFNFSTTDNQTAVNAGGIEAPVASDDSDPFAIISTMLEGIAGIGNSLVTSLLNPEKAKEVYENAKSKLQNIASSNWFGSFAGFGDNNEAAEATGYGDIQPLGYGLLGENGEPIWSFLRNYGFNDIGASGVLGCWANESGGITDSMEGGQGLLSAAGITSDDVLATSASRFNWLMQFLFPKYHSQANRVNYSEHGYVGGDMTYWPGIGLAGWTGDWARRFLNWCEKNNYDWKTLGTQLRWLSVDPTRDLNAVKASANAAGSPAAAASVVLDNYEMYPGFGSGNPGLLAKRQQSAAQAYQEFGGKPHTYDPNSAALSPGTWHYNYDLGTVYPGSEYTGVLHSIPNGSYSKDTIWAGNTPASIPLTGTAGGKVYSTALQIPAGNGENGETGMITIQPSEGYNPSLAGSVGGVGTATTATTGTADDIFSGVTSGFDTLAVGMKNLIGRKLYGSAWTDLSVTQTSTNAAQTGTAASGGNVIGNNGQVVYAPSISDADLKKLYQNMAGRTPVDFYIDTFGGTKTGAHVTSPFGPRTHPVTGKPQMHSGVDISASGIGGMPIYADVNGTVSKIWAPDPSMGNTVLVKDEAGYGHRYQHLMYPPKWSVGDKVQLGDIIGAVGSTGASTGNHLHYTVQDPSAQNFDPATYKYPQVSFKGENTAEILGSGLGYGNPKDGYIIGPTDFEPGDDVTGTLTPYSKLPYEIKKHVEHVGDTTIMGYGDTEIDSYFEKEWQKSFKKPSGVKVSGMGFDSIKEFKMPDTDTVELGYGDADNANRLNKLQIALNNGGVEKKLDAILTEMVAWHKDNASAPASTENTTTTNTTYITQNNVNGATGKVKKKQAAQSGNMLDNTQLRRVHEKIAKF